MALCRDLAQPAASGSHLAMLPLPIFRHQIALNDVSSSKNSLFGISGHLWPHYCGRVSILHFFVLHFSNRHLQTTFYITESSAFKNRILYFRQDDWDVLCAPLIERLTSVTFCKLEEVMLYTTFTVSSFNARILVSGGGNTASAQIRFLICSSFAQGYGSTAHRQSSAEKARD